MLNQDVEIAKTPLELMEDECRRSATFFGIHVLELPEEMVMRIAMKYADDTDMHMQLVELFYNRWGVRKKFAQTNYN